MRTSYKNAALALTASIALAAPFRHAHAARTLVDRVVAVIDTEIITEQELMTQAKGPLSELPVNAQGAPDAAEAKRILGQVLDAEIAERLLAREVRANKERLGVAEKDIDRAVDEVMHLNHVNREQLQSALYGQGMTWSEYRAKIRAQLERTQLLQLKVQGKVQVKEGEAKRRCLERQRVGAHANNQVVCASHILLRIEPGASVAELAAKQKQAQALRTQLIQGAAIGELARAHSDDPSAKDGALGCFGRGEMVEAFEAAAFALGVGETSEIVRTPFGLHLIVVTDKPAMQAAGCDTPASLEPFRAELFQEEMGRQMELWMEQLREQAFVELRL